MNKFKRSFGGILCAALGAAAVSSSAALGTVSVYADNPTVQTIYTADPAPMVWNDTFYLYTGHDADNATGYEMSDWRCYSTTDMKNWVDHGAVLSYTDFEWAEPDSCWAAQCIERNGKFYYYVTLSSKEAGGVRAIGVAVSDSPTGPFKDAIGKPLCGPNWSYIDPTVFIDDDGQAYLYFGNPDLYYVKLKDNMIETDGKVQKSLMNAEQFGVSRDGKSSSYEEGPWIYKRNGLYYMVYAGSGVPETIDYSISDSPTSNWQYKGQIMNTCPTSFTIHPGIIEYKGHAYFTYHTGNLKGGGGFTRSASIEEFTFEEDGSIPKIKATKAGPDQIESFNPYLKNEAETICWEEGVETKRGENGESNGIYVTDAGKGDYIKVAGVDFSENATSFTTSASATGSEGTIEIRLDARDGELVGTVNIPKCEAEDAWQTLTCDISGASGVHDLYFCFDTSETSGTVHFDWWRFNDASNESERTEGSDKPAENEGLQTTTAEKEESQTTTDVPIIPIVIAAVCVLTAIVVVTVVIIAKNKKSKTK